MPVTSEGKLMTHPTPNPDIAAIEAALAAGPAQEWLFRGKSNSLHRPPEPGTPYQYGEYVMTLGSDYDDDRPNTGANIDFIVAAHPARLRRILDTMRGLERERDELKRRLAALDNIPAEDFIRKVAKQMGPPPFDTWPVSHVCQQNADEAVELVEAYDAIKENRA